MRVVVTGAGGSLGRAVVPALAARGHDVCLFDSGEVDHAGDHEVVRGDVRDLDLLTDVLSGGGWCGARRRDPRHPCGFVAPESFWLINATGTFNLYEAARRQQVSHIVLSSSMAVYGAHATPRRGRL